MNPSAGVAHVNVAGAEMKRLMMRAARMRVLVADGSKLGAVSLVHLDSIPEIDSLITDTAADPDEIQALRELGRKVPIVS